MRRPLALLFAFLPLLGWWATGLFDLDEGFYGAIAGEMNRRGEWIVPYLGEKPWFEKPILVYWLAKPALLLFGPDFGARLPSVLCTLGTLASCGWFAARRLREGAGGLATLVLGSSLLPLAVGRMLMTDPPFVLTLSLAFVLFFESLATGDRRFRWGAGAALGAAVLAKGPVAGLLFVPTFAALAWRRPEMRKGWSGGWAVGVVAFLLVVGSWYLPAYLREGDRFVREFLIEQNLGRFTGGDAAHTLGVASLPLYVPVVLLGMLPWSAWLWPAWRRRPEDGRGDARTFLWAWAGTVFVFFTLSGAKLPHYVLPLFPPLAMLVADHLADRPFAPRLGAAMCGVMAVVAWVGFGWYYRGSGQADAHRFARRMAAEPGAVALYRIGRREGDRGTGTLHVRETSLPSMRLYVGRPLTETERFEDLAALPRPAWVFTRAGRLSSAEVRALGGESETASGYSLLRLR